MILIDQIKKEACFISKNKLLIIQQCLSFFSHTRFYLVNDWPEKITIYEYNRYDQLLSLLPNEWIVSKEIIKKCKKSL